MESSLIYPLKIDLHIFGKARETQKHIYDLRAIYSKDIASFINILTILQNNIILSRQAFFPNLLFEKVLTQLMGCQCFPPFIGTKYFFLHFQR